MNKNKQTLIKLKLILFLAMITFFNSCKKDGNGCWQGFIPNGVDVPGLVVCDKTKAEAEAAFPQYWFYRIGEKKYCWYVEIGITKYYIWGVPESMAKKSMDNNGAYHYTKIDCGSFCVLEWLEKHRSKITGLYDPTRGITERLVSADSCSKLFVGKVVTWRETADSLITRELIKKYP